MFAAIMALQNWRVQFLRSKTVETLSSILAGQPGRDLAVPASGQNESPPPDFITQTSITGLNSHLSLRPNGMDSPTR